MNILAVSLTLLALASCGSQKTAQEQVVEETAFECGKQPNDAEVTACLEKQAEKSSRRVQIALQRNLREAAAEDKETAEFAGPSTTTAPNIRMNALKSSQAAWEKYAEEHCKLESYTALGGTAEHHFNLRCFDRMNLQRVKDLRSPFILESQRLQPVPEE